MNEPTRTPEPGTTRTTTTVTSPGEHEPSHRTTSPPEPGEAWELEEEADLAEEMLEAEASANNLEEIEDRLDTLDAQGDTAEALAQAEAVGTSDGEAAYEARVLTPEGEPDLDEIVRRRVEEALGPAPPSGDATTPVEPLLGPMVDEFVCRSCHLVKRRTQLVDPIRMWCHDCTNDPRSGA